MGKGRRMIEKVRKKQRIFIGSKREIVTTMDPAWFLVQSLIFSSDGSSGPSVLLRTTVTKVMMATSFHGSANLLINPKWSSQLSLE